MPYDDRNRQTYSVYRIILEPNRRTRTLPLQQTAGAALAPGHSARKLGLAAALLLAAQSPVFAQAQAPQDKSVQIEIVAAERPPYMFEQAGTAHGPAIELLQLVVREAGLHNSPVRFLPFQRALIALEQGGVLYPALLRTPQREPRFIWVGEIYADRAVFFTQTHKKPVTSLAAVRDLSRISVMRESELQAMLQSFGLEKFDTANSEADNARLLQAGRIDGWFTLRAVGRATWSQLQFTPSELQASESFATLPFWIAGSADLPTATAERLREAYRAIRRDGRYRRIIAPLVSLENPS
ncbi:MAG: transporter substrate-binding domain-containing protein [Ferrovibrio sp.]